MIVKVLDDLGDLPQECAEHVDAEVLARAEAHLIGLAAEHSPTRLRRLAGRLFEVIAPDAAEEIEAKRLATMEQRAEQAMSVFTTRWSSRARNEPVPRPPSPGLDKPSRLGRLDQRPPTPESPTQSPRMVRCGRWCRSPIPTG